MSKSLGFPLGNEILPALDRHFASSLHLLEPIHDFVDYFYPGHGAESPNAEDVLGMLETARYYNGIRKSGKGYRWREGAIESIRTRLVRLLGVFLWDLQSRVTDGALVALRGLVRKLGPRTVYVTFNYDLNLEMALSAERVPYSYGIPCPADGVIVLKPHGSINWFQTQHLDWNASEDDWFCLGEDFAAYKGFAFPEKLAVLRFKEPVLIAPYPNKQVEFETLKRVWTSFSSAIHTAPRILIAGYSLPDVDRLARLVLRRSGPRHHVGKPLTVVNPDPTAEAKFKGYVAPDCLFRMEYFENWVETITSKQMIWKSNRRFQSDAPHAARV